MELNTIQRFLLVGKGSERGRIGGGDDFESFREGVKAVGMGHPDLHKGGERD